jgi:hypothetical protein
MSDALQASSYADLLAPVFNAVAALNADSAAFAQVPPVEGVKLAQYHNHNHNHNHHHHRPVIVIKRHRHHHHHHHHHSGAIIGVPSVGVVVR